MVLPHTAPSGSVSAAGETSRAVGEWKARGCQLWYSGVKALLGRAWTWSTRTKLSLAPGCRSSLTVDLRECSRETRTSLLGGGRPYSDQYEVETRVKLRGRQKGLSGSWGVGLSGMCLKGQAWQVCQPGDHLRGMIWINPHNPRV